jgi:ribosome modulation factor
MERMKKGAELAAWHHGYQAGEFAVVRLCPYSTGSILAKAWHEGYQ